MKPTQRKAMQLKQRARSQANLTLVYGPPCAGKTTYALEHAGPDDTVIDYDLIAVELGSTSTHDHDVQHDVVLAETNRRLVESRTAPHAWLVKCEPTRADMSRAAVHILIDPGLDTCLDRATRERPDGWNDLIRQWYARHP